MKGPARAAPVQSRYYGVAEQPGARSSPRRIGDVGERGYAGRAVRRAKLMPKNRSRAPSLRAARKAWVARADERAEKLAPIIKALQTKGITSLSGIAAALNKRRIRTPRGVGQWQATQVARVLARLEA
jgi:hypothetical protein